MHQPVIFFDSQIPWLQELLASHVKLISFENQSLKNLKPLQGQGIVVRTVTQITEALFADSTLEFVASASAGFEHLDTNWLTANHITWAYAPGCNAKAVVDYVMACINLLQQQNLAPTKPSIGIMGHGHVGSLLAKTLPNWPVAIFDPYKNFFDDVLNCDILCLHANLHERPPYPSKHWLNAKTLQQLKPHTVIINAGRGDLIDQTALLADKHRTICLDVWPNEPDTNPKLLERAFVATPHIAGYSQQAKFNASLQVAKSLAQHFGFTIDPQRIAAIQASITPLFNNQYELSSHLTALTAMMKSEVKSAEDFIRLRKAYSYR